MKTLGSVLCALCASFSVSANAALIDTTASYTGNWQPFGESNTATYGQTFSVSQDSVLDSFSLYLAGAVSNPVDFKGYLYEWNGSRASGAALFGSTAQQFTGSPSNSPTEFSFATGGVSLGAGRTYVAFLSASELFDGMDSTAQMPSSGVSGDVLAGSFVYYNNGANFSLLTTTSWDKTAGGDDVWFKASFSSSQVPEPASFVLLGMGVAGLALTRRRSRA